MQHLTLNMRLMHIVHNRLWANSVVKAKIISIDWIFFANIHFPNNRNITGFGLITSVLWCSTAAAAVPFHCFRSFTLMAEKVYALTNKKKILNTRTLNENAKVRSLYWHRKSKMPVALRNSMNFTAQSEFVAELWMRLHSIIKWILQLKFARKIFKKNLLKSRFADVICSFWMLEKSNTRAVAKQFSAKTTHTPST